MPTLVVDAQMALTDAMTAVWAAESPTKLVACAALPSVITRSTVLAYSYL